MNFILDLILKLLEKNNEIEQETFDKALKYEDDVPVETSADEPVYNRSRTILYEYPRHLENTEFTVPDTVKCLRENAFNYNHHLKTVNLPEGLEKIECKAFNSVNIRSINIPSTVKKMEEKAFCCCGDLKTVNILCDLSCVESEAISLCENVSLQRNGNPIDYEHELRILGKSRWEVAKWLTVPKRLTQGTAEFIRLAKACATESPIAMMTMANYMESLEDSEFCRYAANFWRYRAYMLGNEGAKRWIEDWATAYPRQRIPVPFSPDLSGHVKGDVMRALGFLFFDAKRYYSISLADPNGIVEVDSMCDEDGPDCDGFGRTEYSDWWYLDSRLNPIPGIKPIYGYSSGERNRMPEEFNIEYRKALQVLKQKSN